MQVYNEFPENDAAQQGLCDPSLLRPTGVTHRWLKSIVREAETRPQDDLFKLLRGSKRQATDQTVKTINRARTLIANAFPRRSAATAKAASEAANEPGTTQSGAKADDMTLASRYLYERCQG